MTENNSLPHNPLKLRKPINCNENIFLSQKKIYNNNITLSTVDSSININGLYPLICKINLGELGVLLKSYCPSLCHVDSFYSEVVCRKMPWSNG